MSNPSRLCLPPRDLVRHPPARPPSRATVAALLDHPVAVLSERPAPRLTRLLVNVTVERSLWPVHVVLGADATVADLVRAALAAYIAEGRRPPLPADANDVDTAARFELHLSKYSLTALNPDEKVLDPKWKQTMDSWGAKMISAIELEWLTGGECLAGMHEIMVTK
ncbi:uncharacterized protein LOC124646985 [Lolium rigidum]|uniref:uncharacterized protein LOC124646985 n=1 Tax=Lolium rigidum TaxID=89674 RepID=UPI001F5D9AE5|nr:uncharacterized protein LOC124646985 [Lolium rigidum]